MSQITNNVEQARGMKKASPARNRDFSIWVVPPFNGRVKKLRFRAWSFSMLCCIGVLMIGVVSYVAGDYSRLQLQRAQSYLITKSLLRERDTLKSENEALETRLNQSRNSETKRASYSYSIQQRLDELQSIMAKVHEMGVDPVAPQANAFARLSPSSNADVSKKAAHEKAGIGGAEIDCAPGDLRCITATLSDTDTDQPQPSIAHSVASTLTYPFRYLYEQGRALLTRDRDNHAQRQTANDKLLAKLDQSIETLKALPVSAPSVGEVSSGFGYRHSPFTDRMALHEGMDFAMPLGSKVLCTGDGVVKEVRFNPTYGLVVDVEHTPQVITRYAHLSKALVREGQIVQRGTELGLVGSTGRSTGPHLHYEVRIDGEPHNPKELIALGQQLSAFF